MTVRPCWTCNQPATHALTREGSITLDACDNCTRIDREEAERRGWAVTRINGTSPAPAKAIEIGVRVSGEIGGQSFTGVVRSTGRTGGRSAIAADGTFTTVELGTLDSVTVETDNELITPTGRKVRRAHVTGAEALGSLRIL